MLNNKLDSSLSDPDPGSFLAPSFSAALRRKRMCAFIFFTAMSHLSASFFPLNLSPSLDENFLWRCTMHESKFSGWGQVGEERQKIKGVGTLYAIGHCIYNAQSFIYVLFHRPSLDPWLAVPYFWCSTTFLLPLTLQKMICRSNFPKEM